MGRARPACPRWGRGPAPRWVHSCRTPCARVPIPAPVARWASPDVPLPRAAGWPMRCGGTKRWWAPQRPVLLPAGGRRPSSRPRSRRLVFLVCLAVPGTLLLWWPEGRGRPHHGAGCWRWRPRCLRRCRGARWSPRAASLRQRRGPCGQAWPGSRPRDRTHCGAWESVSAGLAVRPGCPRDAGGGCTASGTRAPAGVTTATPRRSTCRRGVCGSASRRVWFCSVASISSAAFPFAEPAIPASAPPFPNLAAAARRVTLGAGPPRAGRPPP